MTICRPQCTKSAEEEKEVAHEEHQPSRNKEDGGVIDGSGTKRIELTLQNLTDDGRWIVAAWTEWSYRQFVIYYFIPYLETIYYFFCSTHHKNFIVEVILKAKRATGFIHCSVSGQAFGRESAYAR